MTLGLGLVPIAPILLLPVILVVFVVIFPLWVVGLAIVGLIFVIVRGLDALLRLAGTRAMMPVSGAVYKAFRWVLTFGGLAERLSEERAE